MPVYDVEVDELEKQRCCEFLGTKIYHISSQKLNMLNKTEDVK